MQELCLRPPVPPLTLSVEKQSIIPTRLPKDMLLFYSAAERDLTHSQTTELSTAAWEQRRNYCSAECRWDALWLACHWHFQRAPLLADMNGMAHEICVFVYLKGTLPTSRLQISTGSRGLGVCLWPLWLMDQSPRTTCDQSSRLIKEERGNFCSHLRPTAWEEP